MGSLPRPLLEKKSIQKLKKIVNFMAKIKPNDLKPGEKGFSSMKRLAIFLLPPGWDASPSQGYPQH